MYMLMNYRLLEYRLSSIICDVASFRLFKPVRSEPLHDNNRKFLHIPFANKGIDAINISNILRSWFRGRFNIRMLNSFMTMATFSFWNSIKKAHHVDFVASRLVKLVKHCEVG
jgi:hypothetical protein